MIEPIMGYLLVLQKVAIRTIIILSVSLFFWIFLRERGRPPGPPENFLGTKDQGSGIGLFQGSPMVVMGLSHIFIYFNLNAHDVWCDIQTVCIETIGFIHRKTIHQFIIGYIYSIDRAILLLENNCFGSMFYDNMFRKKQ